ncbi:hypothetical protein EDD18DRAFT_171620 [Armillaria luteobubalina]|uniref:Uncharacterized protein n=1 Tax=Armillaria luteobubalina TaxID=153913 RepID=A0AA39Q602_9AGAR|nr:hypothetical protein EDD18DRAFT_171620 [Armillaria luteobubalina]
MSIMPSGRKAYDSSGRSGSLSLCKRCSRERSAVKNRNDLRDLAGSVVKALVVVRDVIECPTGSMEIRRILKRRSRMISMHTNDEYRQLRKTSIRMTATTQLVLSDVQDQVDMRLGTLTSAVEASEKNITSAMKDNIEEMRIPDVLQSETMEKVQLTYRSLCNEVCMGHWSMISFQKIYTSKHLIHAAVIMGAVRALMDITL